MLKKLSSSELRNVLSFCFERTFVPRKSSCAFCKTSSKIPACVLHSWHLAFVSEQVDYVSEYILCAIVRKQCTLIPAVEEDLAQRRRRCLLRLLPLLPEKEK